jgi:hypothetical protein
MFPLWLTPLPAWGASIAQKRSTLQLGNERFGSFALILPCPRHVRFSPNSYQIADAPTRCLKWAPAIPETTWEPQETPMRQQRPRDTATTEGTYEPCGRSSRFTHGKARDIPQLAYFPKYPRATGWIDARWCRRLLLNQSDSPT